MDSVEPTFIGHVASTHDALILFEACLTGCLDPFARRPFDRERPELIKSGNVFVYNDASSGMKRWTSFLFTLGPKITKETRVR